MTGEMGNKYVPVRLRWSLNYLDINTFKHFCRLKFPASKLSNWDNEAADTLKSSLRINWHLF